MAISFEVNVKDNFSATLAKFEAQARGLGETLQGVDSKALQAQNRILSALEKQAKARNDTALVASLREAQKSNLLEGAKMAGQDFASREAAKAARASKLQEREEKKALADSAKAAEKLDKQRKKERIEGEKAAAKQFAVDKAVREGPRGGGRQSSILSFNAANAAGWAFKATVEKTTGALMDLALSVVSGTVAMIDWSIRTKAVEKAYLGSTDAANRSTESYMRQAAFLGKSSEEVAAFNVRLRNIGYGDEAKRSITYLAADMDALGLKSSGLTDALEMARQAELKGLGRVSMQSVFDKLEASGLDLAQVQKQMGDTRPFKQWYREMLLQPVKAGDVWKIFGQQVTALTGQPLGEFSSETKGLAGAFNELKTKWLSTIAAVDWKPLTMALSDISGKVFTQENLSAMASWLANANANAPALFESLLEAGYDFVGALSKAARFLSDPMGYARSGSDEDTGRGPGRSGPPPAKVAATGAWALQGNWKGGDVVGISNGVAQVKAAPNEGLVSIGKGESIVQTSSKGGVSMTVNAPITVYSNGGGAGEINLTGLEEAVTNMFERALLAAGRAN